MFGIHLPETLRLWHWITRLGEAQAVLPPALLTALLRARRPDCRARALLWIVLLGTAVALTTASKVAFIGWGIGSADLDFTGISGHTMLAAAVYPVLLPALAGGVSVRTRRYALAAGCVIAILIGVSRYLLGAHSISEILAGWLAGGLVSSAVLTRRTTAPVRTGPAMPLALALWLTLVAAATPPINTHAIVTRLALTASQRVHPYTRSAMLRNLRARSPRVGS